LILDHGTTPTSRRWNPMKSPSSHWSHRPRTARSARCSRRPGGCALRAAVGSRAPRL